MTANDAPRELLHRLFEAAVAAADPMHCVPPNLPPPPEGRTVVVGAGKASAAMARAVECRWPGPIEGLVVTRYGHAAPCERIEIVEAAHPVPDQAGHAAAARIRTLVQSLEADDLLLCLISGGGSALLVAPAEGVTFAEKRALNDALVRSGATIGEINCVRKHVSALKGGRLAAACKGRVVTLAISDVPGDDPAVIASGPTVGDPTTVRDALAVIERYRIELPSSIARHLRDPASETPKPGDASLARSAFHLVASPQDALDAARRCALEAGVPAVVLSDSIEGESRHVASTLAALARQVARRDEPFAAPVVLLSGGETTVTVEGPGRGGPNAEFALALALALDGEARIHAIACDTDGIDGSEDNAGD